MTVQPNEQVVEDSYDHENATRLIEEMSPESHHDRLNVYQSSAETSANRFSSKRQLVSASPANIKLEPVRTADTSGFDA